jgi:hypothetical protein
MKADSHQLAGSWATRKIPPKRGARLATSLPGLCRNVWHEFLGGILLPSVFDGLVVFLSSRCTARPLGRQKDPIGQISHLVRLRTAPPIASPRGGQV